MSDNVQVAVRVRPFNERERGMAASCCLRMLPQMQQTIITDPESGVDKSFTFDYSYNSFLPSNHPSFASQETVWNDLGITVLEHAWQGFNVSLFAYGQTGSGKSFSMVGYGEDKGIIPRACEVIFARIQASDPNEVTFKVEASMMEIYNERVKDLFNPVMDNLKVRDHPSQGPYAEGLTRSAVSSYEEISRLMDTGILSRTTAATNMNATSSRAHTIFQVTLTQVEKDPISDKTHEKVSRINLIDLAGSERAASTGATGFRLKEGAAINQSLSSLGNCISALADAANGKKGIVIPFRNSKLTYLLKDSLGGNSKTIMIAALSPASVNYSETLSTLRYADRAKQIRTKAVVNEDPSQQLIRQLREELETLRRTISTAALERPMSRGFGHEGENGLGDCSPTRLEERAKEVERVKEELAAQQQLIEEKEKSWAERLRETEELAKKREEELKHLGLVSNPGELKVKMSSEPHLLNLNEDRLMSEKLVYFLSTGENKIGREDATQTQNIIIGGLGVTAEHCVIHRTCDCVEPMDEDDDNEETESSSKDKLFIRCFKGAKVSLNGRPVANTRDIPLNHCDRLILGNFNVFRVVIPSCRDGDDVAEEAEYDWQYAMKEQFSSQMQSAAEEVAAREQEKKEMEAKVRRMEEVLTIETKTAEDKLAHQREEWERHVSELQQQLKTKEEEMKREMVNESEADRQKLAQQLAEQEAKLAEQLAKNELVFDEKQKELLEKQQQLEISLQKQMNEAQALLKQKERERRERSTFDEVLLQCIPLVNEANSIAEELQKRVVFALQLVAGSVSPTDLSSRKCMTIYEEELVIGEGIYPMLQVRAKFYGYGGAYRTSVWEMDHFHTCLFTMREMYQVFIESGRTQLDFHDWFLPDNVQSSADKYPTGLSDPFLNVPKSELIGKSFVYLDSLVYGCKVMDTAPLFNNSGEICGHAVCDISITILSHEWQARQHKLLDGLNDDSTVADVHLPLLEEHIGSKLRLNVVIDRLEGIPGRRCQDVFVEFEWEDPDEAVPNVIRRSAAASKASVNPVVGFRAMIESIISADLITRFCSLPLEIRAFGLEAKAGEHNDQVREEAEASNVDDSENAITFLDMDAVDDDELQKKAEVTKQRRRDAQAEREKMKSELFKCRQELDLQSNLLAENTQELEMKSREAEELFSKLRQESREKEELAAMVAKMKLVNKQLQSRLGEQILMHEGVPSRDTKSIRKASSMSHMLPRKDVESNSGNSLLVNTSLSANLPNPPLQNVQDKQTPKDEVKSIEKVVCVGHESVNKKTEKEIVQESLTQRKHDETEQSTNKAKGAKGCTIT